MDTKFQKKFENRLKHFDDQKKGLDIEKQNLSIIEKEFENAQNGNWSEILDRKLSQIQTIEKQYEIWNKSGIIKFGKKNSSQIKLKKKNPAQFKQYSKKLSVISKNKNRIQSDIVLLRKIQVDVSKNLNHETNNMSIYKENLLRRINQYRSRIDDIEMDIGKNNFFLDVLPLFKKIRDDQSLIIPWCLQKDTKPSFHILRKTFKRPVGNSAMFDKSERSIIPSTSSYSENLDKIISGRPANLNDRNSQVCQNCGETEYWYYDDLTSDRSCRLCGYVSNIKEVSLKSLRGTETEVTRPFHYIRMNHFMDCLKQRQGIESTSISELAISQVCNELLAMKMYDPKKIKPSHIRSILKKIGQSGSYDHEIQIWSSITGNKPPRFSPTQISVLKIMFQQTQGPYEKYKNKRHNYLTYTYAIRKMLEILQFPEEVLEFYPTLRSKNNLRCQDEIWKNICRDLGWCFYESKLM